MQLFDIFAIDNLQSQVTSFKMCKAENEKEMRIMYLFFSNIYNSVSSVVEI